MTPPVETLDLMAAHDIAIAQQPSFTYTFEGRYVANLNGERLAHDKPLKVPMEHGVFLAIGSDSHDGSFALSISPKPDFPVLQVRLLQ